ncbi:cytochrome c biogenesis protein CcdC [Paenibacillus lautus]|uniref:cytochrome c biogenesis protein CcdC n=1 Tax=Paenibacillus lautus TaxID=1401 RepID=UPI000FD86501|nr:cytochrome c biogenesis protein CcdC [Paenibacillus lautus]
MVNFDSPILQIGSTIAMLVMALTVIFIRMKASHRPVTVKKIIIPPLAMSTGFLMFVEPQVRIPIWWAGIAFLVGWFIFSYPLIRSTKFEKVDGQIFMQKSKSFVYILLGLLAVRLLLHGYIEQHISIPQTAALFFMLAYGMIVHWRISMYRQYQQFTTPGTAI